MDRYWRQMWGIARYELRMQWRRGMLRMVMFILPLASVLVIFLLAGMQAQLSASQTQWSAAYPAEFRLTAMAIFILLPAAAPIFAALPLLLAETIPLDGKLNMRDTLDSTPLPLWVYLAGKVLGVWLGVLIALVICIPVVGAVFYWKLGAFNVWVWLQVWGAVVVPSGLLSSGMGVLFAAAAEGEVVGLEALLAAGASLHVTDGDGDTAVTVAAFNGRDRAIACLVAHGASVATRNRFGCTPLHAAAAGGWVDAARELVRLGADRGAKDRTGLTARDMAAGCGHDGELLHVLEASGGDGCA